MSFFGWFVGIDSSPSARQLRLLRPSGERSVRHDGQRLSEGSFRWPLCSAPRPRDVRLGQHTPLFKILVFQSQSGASCPPEKRNIMVASRQPKKVICTIVRVPALAERTRDRLGRPSELLPWADPYIAQLVHNLQEEVRGERFSPRNPWKPASSPRAELEPPCPAPDPDWEWAEEPRFTLHEDTPG